MLRQTYQDWELLLVDDGSTDGTYEKCQNYEKSDNRIRLLKSNRGGVSHARNVGIAEATGEYLLFMDNDDFWQEDTLLENVAKQIAIQQVDVMMYASKSFWPDGKQSAGIRDVDLERINCENKAEALTYAIQKEMLTFAVWTKAIRRELIERNALQFPEGKRNEDIYFTGQLIYYAEKFGWCEDATYMYRMGTGVSQSDQWVSDKTIDDMQKICAEFIDFVNENVKDEDLRRSYLYYISYPYAVWMMYVGTTKNPELLANIKVMKKYSYVLNNPYNRYIKQVKFCSKILGLNMTIRLLAFYYKMKNS